MTYEVFQPEDFEQAEKHQGLGPAYFSARRMADAALADFTNQHLRGLVKTSVDAFYEKLQEAVENSIISDAERNIQGHIWRTVDDTVKALLSGERWALERYCLGSRYDHDKVRKAIAEHIPDEIAKGRIADLEAEIASLKQSLEWARR